jgi:hypothetical protein
MAHPMALLRIECLQLYQGEIYPPFRFGGHNTFICEDFGVDEKTHS